MEKRLINHAQTQINTEDMNYHQENCPAPICAADVVQDWKKNVIWYPGESVCSLKGVKFQKNQRRINKLVAKGTFKHLERYFTATSLEKIGRITSSTKGKQSK